MACAEIAVTGRPDFGAYTGKKVVREHGYVARTISQRRQMEGDDVQTVVQVLTEGPGLDSRPQVTIRRGQDPKVNGDRARTADALQLALLQDPQQLALERVRKLADFVEEHRSSLGELEPAFLLCHGTSKRAALVAKQLAFEKGFGEGGAVDRHKRLCVRDCC